MNPPENISAAAGRNTAENVRRAETAENVRRAETAENVRRAETAERGMRYGELPYNYLNYNGMHQLTSWSTPEPLRRAVSELVLTEDTPIFLRRRDEATGDLVIPATLTTLGNSPVYFIASGEIKDFSTHAGNTYRYLVDNYGRRCNSIVADASSPDIAAAIATAGGSAPILFPSYPNMQIVLDDVEPDHRPLTESLIDQIQLIHYFSPYYPGSPGWTPTALNASNVFVRMRGGRRSRHQKSQRHKRRTHRNRRKN